MVVIDSKEIELNEIQDKSKGKTKDVCTRMWHVVIANPKDKNLEHERIKEICSKSKNKVEFGAMVDEIAPTTGLYHTHLVLIFKNPIRRSTLCGKKWFQKSHCEAIRGTLQDNLDYLLKVNRHEDKKSCQVDGTYEEIGIKPTIKVKQEKEKLTDIILKYVEDGMSTADMIKADSRLINKIREIELTRQLLISKQYMVKSRDVKVVYIWGKPATGKTTYVYEHHNPETICRITNYSRTRGILFDNFESGKHDVLVFEDWSSEFARVQDMLGWLDKWGTMLPSRYTDKCSSYHFVYVISNIPYENQYSELKYTNMDLYMAWDRRVDVILNFRKKSDGSVEIIEQRNRNKDKENNHE